jgi:hypothetical protein
MTYVRAYMRVRLGRVQFVKAHYRSKRGTYRACWIVA